MMNQDPDTDMLPLMGTFEYQMTYLAGSVLVKKDLERADTEKAEACIIMTPKNNSMANEQDYQNILNALSIKKYVYDQKGAKDENNNMKIIMQLIKPESKLLYQQSLNLSSINDQMIIVEEIKMNLLAKSCFAPGLIAMISNLIASAGESDPDDLPHEWLKEYSDGMGHEIYRVKIDEEYY
jgi:hypothetical protein